MEMLHQGWVHPGIAALYHAADKLAGAMPDGSTEGGLIREAMGKIELADEYVGERLKGEAE